MQCTTTKVPPTLEWRRERGEERENRAAAVPHRSAAFEVVITLSALLVAPAAWGEGSCEDRSARGAESFECRLSYENDAGARTYKVYVPSDYTGEFPLPLLVDLHGCGSDADEEARWSRFNELAEDRGFLVAYPEQDPDANGSRCWNWFLPDHQSRATGEPSIIAGITRAVMETWEIDPRRVYVGGISAGGAMADVMAVTYPDLYAAAMVYAGCEYKGTTCAGAVAAVPPEVSGFLAYQEMKKSRPRVVPVIVIQGSADVLVPAPNAEFIVQQFLAMADWSDDGENDGSISRLPSETRSVRREEGWSYTVDSYTDATGCLLAKRWLVHGMGHVWSNAESNGSLRDEFFTDPLGPDVTTPIWEFLVSHPMPESGVVTCVEDEPS